MNTHNPYSPPTAPVTDALQPAAVARKPISVWLLQIVFALAALVILISIPASFEKWRAESPGTISRIALLVSLLFQLLIVTLFVWALIAAQRRSQFGRWLGVFMMGICISIVILGFVNMKASVPESPAESGGRFLAAVILLTPLGLLLYFPAFSKRARAWYAK